MTRKIGNGSIPLRIGRLIDTTVYGGPYKQVPEFFWGVKMAEEITHPHMVAVDTRDFSVPKVSDLKKGIVKALMAMINEEDVYAGCMGGIGRTGIFLAALAKVQIEYRKSKHRAGRGDDPVLYARKHFIPHAVETKQQEEFIANLDVSDIVEWLNATQTAMGLGGLTPARNVPVQAANAWIPEEDKIENPAFDHYQEEWKSTRDSRSLDWMDSPEADSAVIDDAPKSIPLAELRNDARMDDMQRQIDELETKLTEVADHGNRLENGCRKAFKAVEKSLTNATWSSKIRSIFK